MFFIKTIWRRRAEVKAQDKEKWDNLSKEAKAWMLPRLSTLAQMYGFSYNRVFIKHNKTNWGSCSSKQNINLNMTLMLLPEHLREYVMLHELCHLRFFNHGGDFHRLLNTLCLERIGLPEKELRKELRGYRAYTGQKILQIKK